MALGVTSLIKAFASITASTMNFVCRFDYESKQSMIAQEVSPLDIIRVLGIDFCRLQCKI